MEFEIKTTLRKEEVQAFQRLSCRTVLKGRTTAMRLGLLALGVVVAVGATAQIRTGEGITLAIWGYILAVLSIAGSVLMERYLAWKSASRIQGEPEELFFFSEDNLLAESGKEKIIHRYDKLIAGAESQNYFIVFLDRDSGYVLPKEKFVVGDPAQFKAFLERKMGKKIPFVKI